MLIYCFTITAILAFILGFILGCFFDSSGNGRKGAVCRNIVCERELPKEYAAFLNYDGDPRQN